MAAPDVKIIKIGSREFLSIDGRVIPVDLIREIEFLPSDPEWSGRAVISTEVPKAYTFYGGPRDSLKEFIETQ